MCSVLSVSVWMRVNVALQGRWHSIEDECADMTVIHGDVYSKPKEGERLNLRGIKKRKKAKWKKDPACRMFLLNFVEKIGKVYIYDRRQFIHLCVSLQWSCFLSALYDITRRMLLLYELTMLSDMIGSRSALVQIVNTLSKHTHTHKGACARWACSSHSITADNTYSVCELAHAYVAQNIHLPACGKARNSVEKHETPEKLYGFPSVALWTL